MIYFLEPFVKALKNCKGPNVEPGLRPPGIENVNILKWKTVVIPKKYGPKKGWKKDMGAEWDHEVRIG